MPSVRFDPDQRFTCRQCARCCRRGWDIAVTAAEVEGYRRSGVARLFTETDASGAEKPPAEPFEPLGVPGLFRIRKRADGACGFLSPENRCRIHEALGAQKKPLTCRMFPFSVHPGGPQPVLTASLSCPTVAENAGTPLGEQKALLTGLAREWSRAFPEGDRPTELVPGRSLDEPALHTLRQVLQDLLERPGPSGPLRLRENVGRMAALLDDLTRRRVLRLPPAAFAEYLALVGGYAVRGDKEPLARGASSVTRLLGRGLLFAVLAGSAQTAPGALARPWRLRGRLTQLLAHLHGIAPAPADFDLRRGRGIVVDVDSPALQPLVHTALRNAIGALGTGRRPVLSELALAVGLLRAALAIAAVRAGESGRAEVDREILLAALVETADLLHADGAGMLGRFLDSLSAGVEGLYLFAADGGRARPSAVAADK